MKRNIAAILVVAAFGLGVRSLAPEPTSARNNAVSPAATQQAVATPTATETPGAASPTPTQQAAATPTGAETPGAASPTPIEQASPTASALTPITAVTTISARVAIDNDASGTVSPGDAPVSTLVELESATRGGYSLFAADDGTFTFADVPDGDYELWVWWGPGFVNVTPTTTNSGLVRLSVRINTDGSVTASLPSTFLLRPNVTGAVPYPVREGSGGPIPSGIVNVRSAYLQAQPGRALPPTGDGIASTSGNTPLLPALVGIAAFIVAGIASIARARSSRRARPHPRSRG